MVKTPNKQSGSQASRKAKGLPGWPAKKEGKASGRKRQNASPKPKPKK